MKLGTEGPHKTLPIDRLIQLQHGGAIVIKTTSAVLVWEHPYYPQLYIPIDNILSSPLCGRGEEHEVYTDPNDRTLIATNITASFNNQPVHDILTFGDLKGPAASLSSLARIPFDAVDAWFEESTQIYVHPKDPFKRVDTVLSTRPIVVRVGGKVVASTTTSMHLYETGLPTRYYMPLTAIDSSVLRPSKTRTKCPYKGEAEYYSVEVDGNTYEDVVWYYRTPLIECAKIEG
jgi:uncharacterized protein (DUF427 family)